MTNKTVAIVTGAGGFIGSHIAEMLLQKEFMVIGTFKPYNSTRNLSFLRIIQNPLLKLHKLDVRNDADVERLIQKYEPNVIFHFAAQSLVKSSWENPKYTMDTNINGTINIFEAIKKFKLKTRVIVACSSAAYGTSHPNELPLKETNPIRALHPYGISKFAQELLARQYWINFNIETVSLRLFNQTGPRKVNDACSDFALKLGMIETGKSEPIINVGNLDTSRDITGIKDTLQGIWLSYIKGVPGETYNLCSNKATKIRDILSYLVSLCSRKIEINEHSIDKKRISDEATILGDNTKIRRELGYKPTQSIKSVLKEMFDDWIEYFSKNEEYLYIQ